MSYVNEACDLFSPVAPFVRAEFPLRISSTKPCLSALPKLPILEAFKKAKWLQRRALLDLWPGYALTGAYRVHW